MRLKNERRKSVSISAYQRSKNSSLTHIQTRARDHLGLVAPWLGCTVHRLLDRTIDHPPFHPRSQVEWPAYRRWIVRIVYSSTHTHTRAHLSRQSSHKGQFFSKLPLGPVWMGDRKGWWKNFYFPWSLLSSFRPRTLRACSDPRYRNMFLPALHSCVCFFVLSFAFRLDSRVRFLFGWAAVGLLGRWSKRDNISTAQDQATSD